MYLLGCNDTHAIVKLQVLPSHVQKGTSAVSRLWGNF